MAALGTRDVRSCHNRNYRKDGATAANSGGGNKKSPGNGGNGSNGNNERRTRPAPFLF